MSTKRNLLEQAIADAKAVKEMAIANAKVALEEAFEPQLKNLFSLKLQEMSDDDSMYEEEEVEKMDEIDLEELLNELNEEEEEEGEEEGENEPIGDLTKEELEKMIEDVIAEEFPELLKTKGEEGEEEIDMEMDSEEDIELAEILAEIEDMDDDMEDEEEDTRIDYSMGKTGSNQLPKPPKSLNISIDEDEEIEESLMSKIVNVVNKFGSSGRIEDLLKIELPKKISAGKRLSASFTEPTEVEIADLTKQMESDGGAGILVVKDNKVKYVPGSEAKGSAQASTFESMQSELAEAYATIKTLRGDLNEINLLNAKLLYTNKIFKSKNLNEGQKVKVLGSFDKASNVKEVKLVFETLNEGLRVKKPLIKENIGRASKSTNSPTVRQPIVESNEAFTRMQKLAGII